MHIGSRLAKILLKLFYESENENRVRNLQFFYTQMGHIFEESTKTVIISYDTFCA